MTDPDELREDKGTGRLSLSTDRQFRELLDPAHPRTMLGPFNELELVDERVELAGQDEEATMFDPDTHPKKFRGLADLTEPIADDAGNIIDMEFDTLSIERSSGETNRHNTLEGLPELDDLGDLDIINSGVDK